ncbi:hypothetical protein CAL7716_100270 (plasmid) [Calothrix sp. PCC 7716]|nr:hypothetical protein CAL7716_100270 [Calothrix sp. PCC 7716]
MIAEYKAGKEISPLNDSKKVLVAEAYVQAWLQDFSKDYYTHYEREDAYICWHHYSGVIYLITKDGSVEVSEADGWNIKEIEGYIPTQVSEKLGMYINSWVLTDD